MTNISIGISGNKIEDLNILDETNISFESSYWSRYSLIGSAKSGGPTDYHPQYLTTSTTEKEVALPPIFMQVQDSNSKIYTAEDFELVNCTLNETKDGVILDGAKEATVTINGGKISGTKLTINYIDNIATNIDINYSTKEQTEGTVTVTITADEEIQEVEGWTLGEDKKTLTKEYTRNEEETITVYDLQDNGTNANIVVNNIISNGPQVDVEYSTTMKTNQNVTVTITADREIQEVEGWTLNEDRTVLTKEFSENATENITVYDLDGNSKEIKISVQNIDKIPPEIEISYSTIEKTTGTIRVTITSNEEIQEVEGWVLSSDHKQLIRDYNENIRGEEVTVYDIAGNSSVGTITINNIEKEEVISNNEKEIDNTVAPTLIPQTGSNIVFIIIPIVLMILAMIFIVKKIKKYRDIK